MNCLIFYLYRFRIQQTAYIIDQQNWPTTSAIINVESEVNKNESLDEGKKDEVTTHADDDAPVSKEAKHSDDETLTNNDDNNKRRVKRDHSPIVKKRAATGTIKWFSIQKGTFQLNRTFV